MRLLRFALAGRPDKAVLARLAENVCADPAVLHLWETTTEVAENGDGHIHRTRLPTLGGKTIEFVSHTLFPASLPGSCLIFTPPSHRTQSHAELTGPASPGIAHVGRGSGVFMLTCCVAAAFSGLLFARLLDEVGWGCAGFWQPTVLPAFRIPGVPLVDTSRMVIPVGAARS
ncbi:hypothetical protein GCM10011583_60420 [Streptomyces camponoticapitis]|uniref:Uncharacterized protein n=1 Tax=Streptomyces camponoticapitis TaxID=1616125 RepID=A0ABQ2ESN0_9ACTN|nr:hypothetical protein [Streptomyces camponoticapitis]GGK20443.1 hypothetical protein GCM10011583_60420 [Streptomyces camponoticapitis]